MNGKGKIPQRMAAILVYGRAPLAFTGMLCAIGVMWTHSASLYAAGVLCLFVAMCFDLVDGWFSARFHPEVKLAHLADRIMDKVLYSIIFPLVAAGSMWRLLQVSTEYSRTELLHAILIIMLCITVLIRDHFAHFMRGFAIRKGTEPEDTEFTRLRTVVAAPVGALLYAYAFYVPSDASSMIYGWISWMGEIRLRSLFFIEIIFLVINFGSLAGYCRKYGTMCLDELCLGDDRLRRRILSFFPNAMTFMNAMMGMLAVFFAYQGRVREAYLLLMGAAVFDKLDGAMARKLGLTEPLRENSNRFGITLGGVLDDISDAVSFCIAPAWIFYIVVSDIHTGAVQGLPLKWAAIAYALLGFARLVYFTFDPHPIPGFFKGMPTPAAALLVTSPLIMAERAADATTQLLSFWGVFSFFLLLLAAVVMNLYPVRYLHVGRFMDRRPWFMRINLAIVLISIFTPIFGYVMLLYGFLYLFSPLVTGRIDPRDVSGLEDAESSSQA
ncbi:MAG: CDP-alcohol phosphatidyltransferase family protein [Desulfobacteraceae bacterium]|nr:CDP-alcohol phosphatidyltransferase family protein [Desulfobacteraceae bacterium]